MINNVIATLEAELEGLHMSIQEKITDSSLSVPRIPPYARRRHPIEVSDHIVERLRDVLAVIEVWRESARQRRALARLDDRMLKDIGLSREQAEHEICKLFWEV